MLALVVALAAGVAVLAHRVLVAARRLGTATRDAAATLGVLGDELADELAVTSLEFEQLRTSIARRSTADAATRADAAGVVPGGRPGGPPVL